MTNLKPVDVAIIGGGWTGLLLAREITARTSQSVTVFERGIPRKLQDYAVTMDELDLQHPPAQDAKYGRGRLPTDIP
jgi:2-polyprenyl-6-methoxyphenol hydroxylase-like FAD-dependent oxidoreductase